MAIVGKVTPKLYKYLRVAGKSSILETQATKIIPKGALKYDSKLAQSLRWNTEDVNSAYQTYKGSPYANFYLREGNPLSEQKNKLISCLKQGILESSPKSGKFYRGVTNCPDEETASKLVFNNSGFTSVTPEINKRFAESFALGKDWAVIEYDLTKPIKGYQSNNYEVLFNTNAFSPEKYQIQKVKDGLFRVSEKPALPSSHNSSYHYSDDRLEVFGKIPDYYVKKEKFFVPSYTTKIRFGPKKGKTVTYPDQMMESTIALPHCFIRELRVANKGVGLGTKMVQNAVKDSLLDPRTNGRVLLVAENIEGNIYPGGFYYKLGFRFNNQNSNEIMEKWLQSGGLKENAPPITGMMYLPKENIEHCLNYSKK